jgi:solute carrier family 25 aspartate/glutamate transporter 12/13
MEQVKEQLEQVKDAAKETLLGVEVEPGTEYSAQTRNEFMQYAIKDEESGEYYMTAKEFVDAVAPAGENYVGHIPANVLRLSIGAVNIS